MIAVVQRVSSARVDVEAETVGSIGRGLLVLVGVAKGDLDSDRTILARKVAELRIFEDESGRMNRSCLDLGLEVLVVSQFTLCADVRRGRRPGFDLAEAPERAQVAVSAYSQDLRSFGLRVAEGRFGASMAVHLVNDGPATFVLDSRMWRN
ncbi:MAG: D-tyrosyl-tRNA(Tyr) deacylase [Planctomycetes bacterium]|nr:D-tyrosyl-tRNA(Tyr) deacylase [Planctomycetota bacterium]MCC7169782.1 D-tyrosyl-tRNA(Tyr) deacylase [Planctomycetota bacterium]